ncbi:MAG: OmcA/MtrC family decaheme c-type cytochrome [Deltaproteobacteria bacterium]|nr:OmcA/MtrC family decaheme c-type cytochrome [Deltaproteobacteria bacterium]
MQLPRVLILILSLTFSTTTLVYGQALPSNGLKAEIIAVNVPNNRRPVVTFKISDSKGKALNLEDLDPDSIRFTIAAIKVGKSGESDYHNYVLSKVAGKEYFYKGERKKPVLAETLQPDHDRGGLLSKLRPGVFTYTFGTALPANYDKKATHVVGGELTRGNRAYAANPLHEIVPAGGKVKVRRAMVETASCNNCHDPLRAHGGSSREVGYCALCHTAQLTDPESGESLDFKFFVHKVHRGKFLPSAKEGRPYLTVGVRQAVADYSTVASPQIVTTEGIVKDRRNCKACHALPQVNNWKDLPSTVGCVSCHDNVDLKTGKNHGPGPSADGKCIECHKPEGPEFGPSVIGAHTFPGNSIQLPGVVFDILKIEGGSPGGNPVVTFSAKNKKGEPLIASKMNNLRLVLAWPTVDYQTAVEEDARKAQSVGDGIHTYRFSYTIPAEATGSGAVAIQGYKLFDLKKPDGKLIKGQRDAGFNIVKYFPITDKEAIPRRKAVKTENCNACHETLATHGEQRRATEFCVMCHNASHTDRDKRKTAKGPMPPQNVHYKRLIHRIHTGKDLGEPFIIYGGPPAKPDPVSFSDVRFPGDRRNCTKCHEKGANEIPLPAGLLPTAMPQADGTVKHLPPITSACIGCHTKESARAHMGTQTEANGSESCVVCHGVGRAFSVAMVHRR